MEISKKILIGGVVAMLCLGVVLVSVSTYYTVNKFHNDMMSSNDFEEMHNEHMTSLSQMTVGNDIPLEPGQGAFGAIAEIVNLLENDPRTDWSKVNINELREHLVEMDHLVLDSHVKEKEIENGLELTITGEGETINAIQDMVSMHTEMVLQEKWDTTYTLIDKGVILKVTDNKDVNEIRSLGFYGLMAYGGNHHQLHHFMIAKGEMMMK